METQKAKSSKVRNSGTRITQELIEAMGIDLVEAIEDDHADLKDMISTLKSEDATLPEKRKSYAAFSELLKSHSKAEEKAVYKVTQKVSALKDNTLEAFEEHAVADSLMKKIATTKNADVWQARVKVLAEVVEHHIEEEEEEYLPKLSKHFSDKKETVMMSEFLKIRVQTQKKLKDGSSGVLSEVQSQEIH